MRSRVTLMSTSDGCGSPAEASAATRHEKVYTLNLKKDLQGIRGEEFYLKPQDTTSRRPSSPRLLPPCTRPLPGASGYTEGKPQGILRVVP